jgi:hypothetical protein
VGSVHDEVIGFHNLPKLSSRTMALESTQAITEMNTRNFPGGKWGPELEAGKFVAIFEPIV